MRAARADDNQKDIVAALRDAGASVQPLHAVGRGVPDLLVGFRGVNVLMEVKTESKASKLNPLQVDWHESWRGLVCVVRNADEAIAALSLA